MKTWWIAKSNFRIPGLYLLLGLLWILLSDRVLFAIAEFSRDERLLWGQLKGFFYVALTSVLLYFLIRARANSVKAAVEDFERLLDEHPIAMWIYDVESLNFLKVNKAAVELYGYSNEDFLKMNLYDIRPPSEVDRLKQNVKNQRIGYTNSGQWLHKSASGVEFYVNVYSHDTVYKDRKCRIVGVINIHNSVTAELERKNIQKALDNSAIMTISDTSGNILEANEKFFAISGYTREEVIGQTYDIVKSNFHDPDFWKDMWTDISKGISWRGEIKNIRKNKEVYWVDSVVSPVTNSEGEIYRFISIQYDITERKMLQDERTDLLNDFSNYSFQTSHELRAPLSRLMGLIDVFNQHPDRDFMLSNIRESADEVDQVIKKMNDTLSRSSHAHLKNRKSA